MPTITTYVCDLSGFSSTDRSLFATIEIKSEFVFVFGGYSQTKKEARLVHIEVAKRLGLTFPPKVPEANPVPEVSFEGQLKALLRDWVAEIAQEVVDENQ